MTDVQETVGADTLVSREDFDELWQFIVKKWGGPDSDITEGYTCLITAVVVLADALKIPVILPTLEKEDV
jgi:hypothetical protein